MVPDGGTAAPGKRVRLQNTELFCSSLLCEGAVSAELGRTLAQGRVGKAVQVACSAPSGKERRVARLQLCIARQICVVLAVPGHMLSWDAGHFFI